MIKNYKMTIAFDGSRYYGWEHQPGQELTVQGKLESVLSQMIGSPVEVLGAGRTDAGVHARGMVAHVKMETALSPAQIQQYMNHYLPDDICIMELKIASDQFHSRYNAVGKTYRYSCYVGDLKPVFDRKYVYTLESMPDIEQMRLAAKHLVGKHDFASFCGNPKMKKSTVREIYSIDIHQDGDYLHMTFHGKGFLQYMVRILSGTLLEVGQGKRSADSIPALIEAKKRPLAGFTAPAKGLCLLKVDYNKD